MQEEKKAPANDPLYKRVGQRFQFLNSFATIILLIAVIVAVARHAG